MDPRKKRGGVAEREGGAERQGAVGRLADRVEAGDPAEPDDLGELAQLLGDPEADVGRPADQRGAGVAGIERGERIEARRSGEKARLVSDEKVPPVGERGERSGPLIGRGGEPVGGRAVAGRKARVDDRPVAGAAAEIAGELIAEARRRRRGPRMIGGEQAHHDARRAEAALRAVQVDHRLLDRMERVALGEILDGDEFDAVELAKQQDAGVDRLVAQPPALQARQDNRAGAAVAFAAALLRSLGERLLAQPVEHRRRAARNGRSRHRGRGSENAALPVILSAFPSQCPPYFERGYDEGFISETEV